MTDLRSRISSSLKDALKAQDRRRMCTLRLVSAAIKDRDIAARSSGKDAVSEMEVMQILAKMIKQRDDSIESYESAGRMELVEQERQEIEIIREFLPRQLNEEELLNACAEAVSRLGSCGLKDMGKAMAILKEQYPGQMDFAKASKTVKGMLAEAR